MTNQKSPKSAAREFLAEAAHFRLGHLPTESRHPLTRNLSDLADQNTERAIDLLKEVELGALNALYQKLDAIHSLNTEIKATLTSGGRIFLCGCGATGRLSLSLETLWRTEVASTGRKELENSVFSFIAGGDFALVRSVENFEDFPEYGARQLHDLGFSENDLLISTTEGGETPFVIGATEEATRISKRKPYFLFCNPADLLANTVERSRRVIENPGIVSISLETGPMAIAGSTRLQATTVLMLSVGAAMFSAMNPKHTPEWFIHDFIHSLKEADFRVLAELIRIESGIYAAGERCVHSTKRYGITVLTDTTERSPTFSLVAFENRHDPKAPLSWTFLCVPDSLNAVDAWQRILGGRQPRALEWIGIREKFGTASLLGYDFSPSCIEFRKNAIGADKLHIFEIDAADGEIKLRLKGHEAKIPQPRVLLSEHLLLKCAMNISSTLTMGRLGRFKSNLMLYVRAANKKLIDRSVRYIRHLLDEAGAPHSYEEVCEALFETMESIQSDEPAVLRTYERILIKKKRFASGEK